MMRIGQVAEEIGVSTKAIRFYEDAGILPAADRAENGYRVYEQPTVDRLRFIKDAQSAGLTLSEIGTILDLRDLGESSCHHTIEILEGHLSEVDRQIEELRRTRGRLVEMTERAKALDPAQCDDPNRCQTIGSISVK
jgi:MerR family transcriptional regulator, copper efflux regulator